MKPAADKLAAALATIQINSPQIPVLHNADVAAYGDADQIRDALTRQLYRPVRWTETIQQLAAGGIVLMAECGPGKVLAGLAKRIDGNVNCHALTDAAKLEAARAELA
jgi:[acyl-carrier-protein] S-malonyltransferase